MFSWTLVGRVRDRHFVLLGVASKRYSSVAVDVPLVVIASSCPIIITVLGKP